MRSGGGKLVRTAPSINRETFLAAGDHRLVRVCIPATSSLLRFLHCGRHPSLAINNSLERSCKGFSCWARWMQSSAKLSKSGSGFPLLLISHHASSTSFMQRSSSSFSTHLQCPIAIGKWPIAITMFCETGSYEIGDALVSGGQRPQDEFRRGVEGGGFGRRRSREMPRNGAVTRQDELAQTAARAASIAVFSLVSASL